MFYTVRIVKVPVVILGHRNRLHLDLTWSEKKIKIIKSPDMDCTMCVLVCRGLAAIEKSRRY